MKAKAKLRELRKKRKLSVKDVSRGTGVSEKIIRELEWGERRADIKYVMTLAEYFEVSMETLMSLCEGGDR